MPLLFVRNKKNSPDPKGAPVAGPRILREIFSGKRRHEVQGIGWWTLGLLLGAAFWPHAAGGNALGPAGEILFRLGLALLGFGIYALPLLAAMYGVMVFRGQGLENPGHIALGLGLAGLGCLLLVNLLVPGPVVLDQVRPFYATPAWQGFWSNLPPGFRLWGAIGFPAGGWPAKAAADFFVTIFSSIGSYILSGLMLVISLYLLEAETKVAGTIRAIVNGVFALGHKRLPLDYAETPKPKKNQAAAKAAMADAAGDASPERPKIKITTAPESLPNAEAERGRPRVQLKPVSKPMAELGSDLRPDSEPGSGQFQDEQAFNLPGLEFLHDPKPTPGLTTGYFENMSQTLEKALAQFGVSAKVVEVCPGPVVTRYELAPAPGVKVNRIISLADDIALAMKAEHVRIEAPIPGKGAVGIEIPNSDKQVVTLKELLGNPEFKARESVLAFAIGKDIGGQHIFAHLDAMPHLLIAGATGSGKSACINSIICSLLYRATPNDVRFLMIDPKRVELTVYNRIPHLKTAVITDSQQASVALKLLVREMEGRYRKFAQLGVRDIKAYNEACRRAPGETEGPLITRMPYIVVFIDELADLMMVSANEVENSITRLAQMARGVGIHLVLATQRPSVDVITGVIKANFPSRIAFQVSSKVDSRTILDTNGADALLGRGDMLYSPASASKPLRVQGVFVTTAEVERLADFWRQQAEPVYDPAFTPGKLEGGSGESGDNSGEEDALYAEAVSWVVRAKQASTSLLQRRLKIGYSRAARLLDMMEDKGVVGPPEGSKPRKVLVNSVPGAGDLETVGEDEA